jgi:polar amino acid transport system substrate-binding protein
MLKLCQFLSIFLLCFNELPLQAKALKLAIGMSLPPYVIAAQNTGIEYEIVQKALAFKGHTIDPQYMSMSRLVNQLEEGKVDGALTQNAEVNVDYFLSDVYINYQNAAITLKENSIKIQKITDLKHHKVLAFQSAEIYLGDQYRSVVEQNPNYSETPEQVNQNVRLYKGLVDVVIADANIFKYFNFDKRLRIEPKPVQIATIFEPTRYRMAFKDKSVAEDFNAGLKAIKKSGDYQRIFDRYLKRKDSH